MQGGPLCCFIEYPMAMKTKNICTILCTYMTMLLFRNGRPINKTFQAKPLHTIVGVHRYNDRTFLTP